MRDTERAPRHAVLAAETPFGFPGGTRITRPDRSPRRDDRSGHRPLPPVGDDGGRSARREPTSPRGCGRCWRCRVRRAERGAGRRARRVLPLDRAVAQAARDALAAARKALADLQIPSTLVMKERPSFERPSFELRERGSFTARGERVYARTPRRSIRCATICRSTGSASRDGWSTRTTRSSHASPSTGSGSRSSAGASSRPARTSAPRARCRRIRSCSTGSPPSSSPGSWSQKALLRTIVRLVDLPAVLGGHARRSRNATRTTGCSRAVRGSGWKPRWCATSRSRPAVCSARRCTDRACSRSQPAGIWNMPYNSDKWTTSEGEDRYRRSLYTFWRRTSPYPSFMTFDATSREFCTVRRVRTNTPLQALTLLNDPASFEAARALAGRMIGDAGAATPGRAPRSASSWCSRARPGRTSSTAWCRSYDGERRHYRAARGARPVGDRRPRDSARRRRGPRGMDDRRQRAAESRRGGDQRQ